MNQLFAFLLAAMPVGEPAAPDPKLTALVRQLGHKSFAVRETAARDLVKAGAAAMPALRAGASDADAEVAERCKKLIPAAAAASRTVLLAELLREPPAPPPEGLAGAKRFLKITGDTKETRQIYAEMLTAHHQIIETMEENPRLGSQLMTAFIVERYEQLVQQRLRAGKISGPAEDFLPGPGQAALLMFVRSDPRYVDDERLKVRVNRLASSGKLRASLAGPGEVPALRKLFLHWLSTEKQYFVLLRVCQIAAQARMTEAVPALQAITANRKHQLESRLTALVTVGQLGDKTRLPDVAPLLTDTTAAGTFNLGDGPLLEVQVRDVALFVSVQLAGEKLDAYGFDTARFGAGPPPSFETCGFPDADAREKAHAKWKALMKGQGPPAGK